MEYVVAPSPSFPLPAVRGKKARPRREGGCARGLRDTEMRASLLHFAPETAPHVAFRHGARAGDSPREARSDPLPPRDAPRGLADGGRDRPAPDTEHPRRLSVLPHPVRLPQ